jgi:hypothetical protein
MDKELKKLLKRLKKGYTVVPAGKHQKIKNAQGKTIYTLPTSPSGQVWRVRLERDLKKRGLID